MASRANLRDATALGLTMRGKTKFEINIELLAAQKALEDDDVTVHFLDPNGATQDVLLPAEASSAGLMFIIVNTGAATEELVVKDDSDTNTIGTLTVAAGPLSETGIFICDGTTWHSLVGGAT